MPMKKLHVDERRLLGTLAWILYTPHPKVKRAVEQARERIRKSGARHWPPETDDENLVSLYDAVGPYGPVGDE